MGGAPWAEGFGGLEQKLDLLSLEESQRVSDLNEKSLPHLTLVSSEEIH